MNPEEKTAGRKGLILGVIIGVLAAAVIALVILLVGAKGGIGHKEYKSGIAAMESGDWNTAIEYFQQCEEEDAPAKIDECKLEIARGLIENEEWDDAQTLLEEISENPDAEGLLDECRKHTLADEKFLADLEGTIIKHVEMLKGKKARTDILAAELDALSGYYSEEFYSINLKTLAEEYLDLLSQEREDWLAAEEGEDGLSEWWYYQPVVWQERIDVCKCLIEFCEEYGLFADDDSFQNDITSRVSELEDQLFLINAFTEDFTDYRSNYNGSGWGGYDKQCIQYKNNTPCSPNVTLFFTCYNAQGAISETDAVTLDFPSGVKTPIVFKCNATKSRTFDYDWFVNVG